MQKLTPVVAYTCCIFRTGHVLSLSNTVAHGSITACTHVSDDMVRETANRLFYSLVKTIRLDARSYITFHTSLVKY